jgi:hypothetical protein
MSRDAPRAPLPACARGWSYAGGEGQGIGMDASRRPNRLCLALLAVGVLCAAALPPVAVAQNLQTQYTRQNVIRVPFMPVTSGRIKRVMLYVSTDGGREWQPCSEAAPTDRFFRDYNAPGDGTYLFAVRSVDTYDQYSPPSLSQLTPEVKVIIDTRPPVVSIKQIDDPRSGIVSLEWDVRDENLDLNRFTIEHRVPGRTEWERDTHFQAGTTGRISWNIDPGLRMDVRLRAGDRAGNAGEATIQVGAGADNRPVRSGGGNPSVTSGDIQHVRSRTVHIKCNVSYGLSGPRDFDLWFTRDGGRHWEKAPKKMEGSLPVIPPTGDGGPITPNVTLIFESDADGLYGFVVVLRNGVGIGDPDPRPGDPPKFSVEVDTVAPMIKLGVRAGSGADMRNVTIQWSAEDKNLGDRPVLLEYADVLSGNQPGDGDWKPLPNLTGTQDRSGIHVWTIGRDGPFKFLIRATVTDKAKNKSTEVIKEPIVIDVNPPRVDITGIDPGTGK